MKTSEKNTLNENRMASGRFCAPVQVMPWEARAAGIIGRLARAGRVFTTDDIWLQLTRAGVAVPTHERRALGGILRAAKRRHVVRSAGVCKSVRASRQGGYVTMWVAA